MNIGEYCHSQYIILHSQAILLGTIFTNIHAITLYYNETGLEMLHKAPWTAIYSGD